MATSMAAMIVPVAVAQDRRHSCRAAWPLAVWHCLAASALLLRVHLLIGHLLQQWHLLFIVPV